jgi:acylphosphatase
MHKSNCVQGRSMALSSERIWPARPFRGRGGTNPKELVAMSRKRMHIFYSGNVQGVGFRYEARSVANGYEVTGVIRNLPDGRVELVAEGDKAELEAFRQGIRDSGMEGLIRQEQVTWREATNEFRGFEIVR